MCACVCVRVYVYVQLCMSYAGMHVCKGQSEIQHDYTHACTQMHEVVRKYESNKL